MGSLFKTPKPAPIQAPPPLVEPVLAPDPDDEQAKLAKRRQGAERRRRSGRASTINTPVGSTTLGSSPTTGLS